MTATMLPLVNLKRQHVFLEAEISEAIAGVIAANAFIGGNEVTDFEDEFAHYCGTDHCVGVANGTDARASTRGRTRDMCLPCCPICSRLRLTAYGWRKTDIRDVDVQRPTVVPANSHRKPHRGLTMLSSPHYS